MHPSSLELEAFSVGETSPALEIHLGRCAACREYVQKLGQLPVAAPPKPKAPPRHLTVIASLIVPLAAAAALFFVLKRPPPSDVVTPIPRPSLAPEPETTFKGALPIAIIRERDGSQERFTGRASIRPGDRLRVEVALDREATISAGVLGDDGSWLELMPEGSRAAGTHFSEKSARVDADPLRGTIVVGSPAQVELARTTRSFGGVSTLRLDWEAP